MAEYLIQGETLDDIADAINVKTGGSSAMTPAEIVTAIESISGGGSDTLTELIEGTLTSYSNQTLYRINAPVFQRSSVKTVRLPSATLLDGSCFAYSALELLFAPNAQLLSGCCRGCNSLKTAVIRGFYGAADSAFCKYSGDMTLEKVDIGGASWNIGANSFNGCSYLTNIVLRRITAIQGLGNLNAFTGTPFASGGSGGTIYIPKVLYDELGTGSANDYKAATNWSTIDGYGTITWAQIEGSIYETQYADGTPIPTE